jgi:hypothetical protein
VYFFGTVVKNRSMPPELEWGTSFRLIHDPLTATTSGAPTYTCAYLALDANTFKEISYEIAKRSIPNYQ